MNVFHITRCIAAPRAYGGYNRSQQILEILSRGGIHCHSIDLFSKEFGQRVANFRAGLPLALRPDFPGPRSSARLWTAGHFRRLLAAEAGRHPETSPVLIWENTGDELLAHAAAQLGWEVVALPHDLVSLNRSVSSDTFPALAEEVRGLERCDRVFTISLEERWLLQLFGCSTSYLPYYPPTDVETSLLRARSARRPAANAPVLLLGSVSNPQTRAGLEYQLRRLRTEGPNLGRRVILAGNGTEELTASAGADVQVRGAVTDEELGTLMAEAAVLWTHQIAGTGALTRVVEALMAGLPVAGGGVALRSTSHLADVYPVESVAELRALLPTLPAVAAMPARPRASEENFVNWVRALA